jgi:hypothetical protein
MRNWSALDEPEQAAQARTWLYLSIVQLLSQYSVPFIAHPLLKGLIWLFPFFFFLVWYFSFARNQSRYLKQNALDDYTRKSWAKVLTISTIGFVLYVCLSIAILGALSYITKSSTEPAEANTDYAKFAKAGYSTARRRRHGCKCGRSRTGSAGATCRSGRSPCSSAAGVRKHGIQLRLSTSCFMDSGSTTDPQFAGPFHIAIGNGKCRMCACLDTAPEHR